MEPREASAMEERENGGTDGEPQGSGGAGGDQPGSAGERSGEQAGSGARTGSEQPGSPGGAAQKQAGSAGGTGGEKAGSSRAASLVEDAIGQLTSLDWALLMLIPAAELQAVDRTLSLDPVDVDKTASQFLEAAESIQRTFTELRMQEVACDEATQLQTINLTRTRDKDDLVFLRSQQDEEIHGLEAELKSMEGLMGRIRSKLGSWQGVLAHHKASLDKSLSSV